MSYKGEKMKKSINKMVNDFGGRCFLGPEVEERGGWQH